MFKYIWFLPSVVDPYSYFYFFRVPQWRSALTRREQWNNVHLCVFIFIIFIWYLCFSYIYFNNWFSVVMRSSSVARTLPIPGKFARPFAPLIIPIRIRPSMRSSCWMRWMLCRERANGAGCNTIIINNSLRERPEEDNDIIFSLHVHQCSQNKFIRIAHHNWLLTTESCASAGSKRLSLWRLLNLLNYFFVILCRIWTGIDAQTKKKDNWLSTILLLLRSILPLRPLQCSPLEGLLTTGSCLFFNILSIEIHIHNY